MKPDLTLDNVKTKVREHRASDFLTKEQVEEVKKSNLKGKKNSKFNQIDAYVAEIIARFGYETYVAWKNGEIDEKSMAKYIMAERCRDAKDRLKIESIIISCHAHKGLKMAVKMLKNEEKLAKGEI